MGKNLCAMLGDVSRLSGSLTLLNSIVACEGAAVTLGNSGAKSVEKVAPGDFLWSTKTALPSFAAAHHQFLPNLLFGYGSGPFRWGPGFWSVASGLKATLQGRAPRLDVISTYVATCNRVPL